LPLQTTANLKNNFGTISYQWYSNSVAVNYGGNAITGATNSSYTPSLGGSNYYYAVVTNALGCSVNTAVSGVVTLNGVSSAPAFGNALYFDGSNDFVTINQTSAVRNLGVAPFTMEAMIYLSNTSGVNSIIRKSGDYNLYNNSAFIKGIGVALDFDIRFNSKNKKGDAIYFQVMGRNLGFVSAITSQSRYSSNSQVTYTGFSYDEIINGGSIINDNVALMDSLGIDESTTKKSEFLPGLLQASKLVDVNSKRKLQEFYGGRMYLSKISIPQVFGGLNYHPIEFLNIGASVSYGGFSKFKGGAYLSFNQKKLNIGVASENLFSKTGVSYLIRLQCAF
jgi:hypothetical protein